MVQFLSNQLFLWLMADSDYELLVPSEVMDGEVIPHTEKFSGMELLGSQTCHLAELWAYLLHYWNQTRRVESQSRGIDQVVDMQP